MSQLTREELDELANFNPTLTYGQMVQAPPEDFLPAHVGFDKKVLLFEGYFKQTVHESADEYYRVRPVKIYYYLEDDSIAVIEPAVQNRYVVMCWQNIAISRCVCFDILQVVKIGREIDEFYC